MRPIFFIIILLIICSCSKKTQDKSVSKPPVVVPPVTVPPVNDTAVEYFVAPAQTDPLIDIALDSNFISVKEKSTLKNILFVFLPGSYAAPVQYKGIVRKAAELGYHSVGLMYPDNKPVNTFCAITNDTTCHRRARLEIVDGVDRHPDINVNFNNCIINRLTKLLIFLQKNHSSENWGQFLDGSTVIWSKVIMAGHSQGGGNAAVMGKFYPVKKVIMFSMMDYMTNGKTPDWENLPANKGNYFDIFNPLDEDIPYAGAQLGWQHLGMTTDSSAAVNSDSVPFPYNHTHVLLTSKQPAKSSGPKYHNSTAMDAYVQKDTSGKYVLDKQWEFLISE